MIIGDVAVLQALLKQNGVKPKTIRELRFADLVAPQWQDCELVPLFARDGGSGVLLVGLDAVRVLPFWLNVNPRDKSGRAKPITCDLCYTWQQGANAGRITFVRPSDKHTITFICCGDLRCSLHVRSVTPQAILSRTQLHEDMTDAQRAMRLRRQLADLLAQLDS